MSNEEIMYCRVPAELKAQIAAAAQERGEKDSVIIREALRLYFKNQSAAVSSKAPAAPIPARDFGAEIASAAAAQNDKAKPTRPPNQPPFSKAARRPAA